MKKVKGKCAGSENGWFVIKTAGRAKADFLFAHNAEGSVSASSAGFEEHPLGSRFAAILSTGTSSAAALDERAVFDSGSGASCGAVAAKMRKCKRKSCNGVDEELQ